jgi:hypothetical protein
VSNRSIAAFALSSVELDADKFLFVVVYIRIRLIGAVGVEKALAAQ